MMRLREPEMDARVLTLNSDNNDGEILMVILECNLCTLAKSAVIVWRSVLIFQRRVLDRIYPHEYVKSDYGWH